MRPRAGTHPVTLEPPTRRRVLALARQHDDTLKEIRQDLFRAETKLRVERRWKWPIRLGCVALGAGGLAMSRMRAFRRRSLTSSQTPLRTCRTPALGR